MNEEKRYYLRKGTILDGRYELTGVLGEGGFGITYAGVNLHNNVKVAIKEFYCRDYMDRAADMPLTQSGPEKKETETLEDTDTAADTTSATEIIVSEEGRRPQGKNGSRFENEKNRFMREARIIGEFKEEPGVVKILDYFEANGTAYIVMNYLDGETLHDYVHGNGPMEPAQLSQEIRPLLRTLSKIHRAGVVHRDISPDNIMRLADGSLVLIDFGSAKELSSKTTTYTVTYKEGFAPPEQYSSSRKPGPNTDIYALASTMYYCLTGKRPVASLQRVLVDDLESLGDFGVSAPRDFVQMIDKGMSLQAEDRQQSVDEILKVIDRCYPEVTQEELERKKKAKRIKIFAVAAALMIAAVFLTVHFVRNSTEYTLSMQETLKVHLTHKDMSKADFAKASKMVKSRLDVFAGHGQYLWKENKDDVVVEFPVKYACGNDPDEMIRALITRPMRQMQIVPANEDGEPDYGWDSEKRRTVGLDFKRKDIKKVGRTFNTIDDGAGNKRKTECIEILFTDSFAKKMKKYLSKGAESCTVVLDGDAYYFTDSGYFYHVLHLNRNGNGGYIAVDEALDKGIEDGTGTGREDAEPSDEPVKEKEDSNIYDTLISNFRNEPETDATFGVESEWRVNWEDVKTSLTAGLWQRQENEIKGSTMLLKYSDDTENEWKKTDWLKTVIVMKDRLDALKTPYAFGTLESDEHVVLIKMEQDAIKQSEAQLLCKYVSSIITSNKLLYGESVGNKIEAGDHDGKQVLYIKSEDYYKDDIKKIIKSAKKEKSDTIYLMGGNREFPLMSVSLDEFTKAGTEIYFTDTLTPGIDMQSERGKAHVDFISMLFADSPEYSLEMDEWSSFNEKGDFTGFHGLTEIDGGLFDKGIRLARKIKKDMKGRDVKLQGDISDGDFAITIELNDIPTENFEKEAIKAVSGIIGKYDLEGNDISQIHFYMKNKGYNKKRTRYMSLLYYSRHYDTGKQNIDYMSIVAFDDKDQEDAKATREAANRANKYLEEDKVMSAIAGKKQRFNANS